MTTLSIPLPGKRIALMMCILSKMLEKVCSFDKSHVTKTFSENYFA